MTSSQPMDAPRKSTIVRFIVTTLALWLVAQMLPAEGPRKSSTTGSDPIDVGPEARRWARTWTTRSSTATSRPKGPLQRIARLREAIESLSLEEVESPTLEAAEAFARRQVNCVSYAAILVSLARSMEVDAYFVLVEERIRERTEELEVRHWHMAVGYGPRDRPVVIDLAGPLPGGSTVRPIDDDTARGIVLANRGAERLRAGGPQEAVRFLERAVSLAPALEIAWTNLGVARRRAGDLQGAESAYWRAINLDPESVAAWRNLALLLGRGRGPASSGTIPR